jgi:hypothetical protein
MKMTFSYIRTGHPRWKYKLTEDLEFDIPQWVQGTILCLSEDKPIARFSGHSGIIYSGYAWDGCTWAPDFEKALRASVIHDIGCQFQCVGLFRDRVATRAEVDKWFQIKMQLSGFKLRWLYFPAVFIWGKITKPQFHPGISCVEE